MIMIINKNIEVRYNCDLCVLGGSATGVFAAVRAARLGLNVILIEKSNCFGGTATNGLVNVWHSMYDYDGKERIIAGLSLEVINNLIAEGEAVSSCDHSKANVFNPVALEIELDRLVSNEPNITVLFDTMYSGVDAENCIIRHAIICNREGISAVRAAFFIDATGDGYLLNDLGVESYIHSSIQPPTSCFLMKGHIPYSELAKVCLEHSAEFGLPDDWGWYGEVPGMDGITFRADYHIFDRQLLNALDYSHAEIEGRNIAQRFEKMIKKYVSKDYAIVSMCRHIGIRETRHFVTRFKANEMDLLTGKTYDDTILNGTYRVDIHHSNDNGLTLKELDGTETVMFGKGGPFYVTSWREKHGLDNNYARFYRVPFSILVQDTYVNLIGVGRIINADIGAYGALRVMINLNQIGEAAGTAAYIAINSTKEIQAIDGAEVKGLLNRNGSCISN